MIQSPKTSDAAELVILNQYYHPDVASTGHLLHELAIETAKLNRRVSVVTCFPSYGPRATWVACAKEETVDGVRIHRMRTTRFSKDRLLGRLCNAFTFLGPLLVRQAFASNRNRVSMYTSNPTFLGLIGGIVNFVRRHRYIILLHDSYPHLAVRCGKIRSGGLTERIWHAVNRLMYQRASETIVLCEMAKELIVKQYGISPDRVHVIHNWADPNAIKPIPKDVTVFAKNEGLIQPFTLLYSGNLGLYYEFESLLDVAHRFRDDPNFQLVFIGAGGRRSWIVAEIARRSLKNVQMHAYQPFETLNDSLNACDISLVTIAKGIEGISFPSKLYSSLAVGKPVLAISESGSELRRLVEGAGAGVWHSLGDIDGIAASVRRLREDPALCARMGVAARASFDKNFTAIESTKRYLDVVDSASTRHRSHSA